MDIKEAIKRIIKDELHMQVIVGTVKSFDAESMTCDIKLQGSADMQDVRIRSVIDSVNSGILIEPAIDSFVLIGLIDNRRESAFICAYSQIVSIKWIIEDIQLGGDEFGGLVKSEVVSDDINGLKDEINQLKNILTAWIPAPTDGGAALKASISAWAASPIAPSVKANFENEKVKHG